MYGDAYRRGFERVSAFVQGRDTGVAVPATPDWSVGDVVRHLAGIANDLVQGRIEGFASDDTTAMQVAQRSLVPVPAVLDEWASRLDDAAQRLDHIDEAGFPDRIPSGIGPLPLAAIPPMIVNDLVHHEFDIRNAFGDVDGRDLPEILVSAAGHARSLRTLFAIRGLPTIRIESADTGQGWNIGRDEPVATLRASSFELMRSIGGRRTRREIASLDWDGDPEPFLDSMVLPQMRMRTSSLGEAHSS